jgi:predicted MFS family arabinose efflux permease
MRTAQYKYLPFLMWLLPLSFFTYQFILRLWPGLMMHQIMEQFSIDATGFGLLAAFYYYGYSSMQIPVAILLDRFSVRYIICGFALLCGLATLLFTITDNFYLALLSRFLIGTGSAVGFLATSKVLSLWFPKDQYARMIGFSFTLGLMGAIYGGKPVSLLIDQHSWHNVALTLAVISMAIGCLTFFTLRTPKNNDELTAKEQFRIADFKSILSSEVIWWLALANLLMVGSLEGFADVWGLQYLMIAYDLSKCDAASLISNVFYGMIVGGPLLAFFSQRVGNYSVIAACGFGMSLAFIFLLFSDEYHHIAIGCLFFAVGVMCCYQVIVFAAGSDLMPPKQLGVTVAFLNCINMLGGSFFHTIIGFVMDLFWTGSFNDEGIRIYDLETYKYAISVVPVCAILGALIVCVIGRRR